MCGTSMATIRSLSQKPVPYIGVAARGNVATHHDTTSPQSAIKSPFLIVLFFTTSRRIPTSASTD